MAYTYDNFVTAANGAGLLSSFSPADLATAQKYPEFGISLLSLKQDYANAQTTEAKTLAHSAAESLRESYGNYSGGNTGSEYISGGLSPSSFQSENADGINGILDQMKNFGEFEYDPENDDVYSAYKKQYLREADRTIEDTLGKSAALTGGIPSTSAVTAATQAGDYQKTQLTDKIPELEQNAHGEWVDRYNMLGSTLSALQNQDDTDYARLLNQISGNTDKETTQAGVDSTAGWTMLQSGIMPSSQQLAEMGITTEQASKYLAPVDGETSTGGGTGTGYTIDGVSVTKEQYDAYYALVSGTYTAEDVSALINGGLITKEQLTEGGYSLAGSSGSSWTTDNGLSPALNIIQSNQQDTAKVINKHGESWVYIPGHGRFSYQELYDLVEKGTVTETYDAANNAYTYKWAG
ncbi:MAG: hypothetical protein EOM03_05970 [Clostridia bacterium]|nr:hypothetical protein [Clostridia bacterium]